MTTPATLSYWDRQRIIWRLRGIGPSERLLLLALAYHCGDSLECWPQQRTLASEVGVSRRHVIRIIDELEQRGWLDVRRSWPNRYRINWESMRETSLVEKEMGHPRHIVAPENGDVHVTLSETNVTPMSHCENEKCDTHVTLLPPAETEKCDTHVTQNVTSMSEKCDTHVTVTPKNTQEHPKEEERAPTAGDFAPPDCNINWSDEEFAFVALWNSCHEGRRGVRRIRGSQLPPGFREDFRELRSSPERWTAAQKALRSIGRDGMQWPRPAITLTAFLRGDAIDEITAPGGTELRQPLPAAEQRGNNGHRTSSIRAEREKADREWARNAEAQKRA